MKNKLSEGWKEVELGTVTEIFNGKTPSEAEKREKGKPILKIKDVNADGCFKGSFDSFVDINFYNKHSDKIVKNGDTLVLNAAHNSEYVGSKTFYVENLSKDTIATGEWLIIRAKHNLLDNKFKHYLITSSLVKYKIKEFVKGIHLYPKDVKLIKIPLPSLLIQKQIVSILEKAEKLKQKREEADKLTKDYLQSVFYEMFGDSVRNEKNWSKKKLGEISKEIQPGFAYGQFNKDEGLIHIRPFNISNEGFLIFEQIKYIPKEEVNSEKYFLLKGDILINTTNSKELVGKTAIFDLNKKYCFSNHMTKIRVNTSLINPNYLWFVLNNYWRSGFFRSIIKSWVNQVGIDSTLLKNQILVPLPPLPLQKKFASIVEQVEKLKEKQKQSKENINNLFNSLMQKAFKGELVR